MCSDKQDGKTRWNQHVGLTYTTPETAEDGIDFSAVSRDGREYRFHLELKRPQDTQCRSLLR